MPECSVRTAADADRDLDAILASSSDFWQDIEELYRRVREHRMALLAGLTVEKLLTYKPELKGLLIKIQNEVIRRFGDSTGLDLKVEIDGMYPVLLVTVCGYQANTQRQLLGKLSRLGKMFGMPRKMGPPLVQFALGARTG